MQPFKAATLLGEIECVVRAPDGTRAEIHVAFVLWARAPRSV